MLNAVAQYTDIYIQDFLFGCSPHLQCGAGLSVLSFGGHPVYCNLVVK